MEGQSEGRKRGDGESMISRFDGQNLDLVGNILGFKDHPIFQLDTTQIDSQKLPLHHQIANPTTRNGETNLESLGQTTDINLQDEYGNTALHLLAISNDTTALMSFLQSPNLDLNIRNNNGQTALHLAILANNLHAARSLLAEGDRVDFTAFDNHGNSPFHYAAIQADAELLDFLIDSSKWDSRASNLLGRNPLHIAAEAISKRFIRSFAIRSLLEKACPCHCPITARDAEGDSPYNIIVRTVPCHDRGILVNPLSWKMHPEWEKDHLIAVKTLLDKDYIGSGCLNRKNKANKSPLQEACERAFTSHEADILDLVLEYLFSNLGTFDVDDSSLHNRLGPILHYALRTDDHTLLETRTKRLIRGPFAPQVCTQVSSSTGKSVLHLLAEGFLEDSPEMLREITKIIGNELECTSEYWQRKFAMSIDNEGYTALHRAIIAAESGKIQALTQWFLLPTSKSAPLIKFEADARSGPLQDTHLHAAIRALPPQTSIRVCSVLLHWDFDKTVEVFQKRANRMGLTPNDLFLNKFSLGNAVKFANMLFFTFRIVKKTRKLVFLLVLDPVLLVLSNVLIVWVWIEDQINSWVFGPRCLERAAAEGDLSVGGFHKCHYQASSGEKARIRSQTMLEKKSPVPIAWYPWFSPALRIRKIARNEYTYLWEYPPDCACISPQSLKDSSTPASKASFESDSMSNTSTTSSSITAIQVQQARPEERFEKSYIPRTEDLRILVCTETIRLTPFLRYDRNIVLSQQTLVGNYDWAAEKLLEKIREHRAKAAGFRSWRTRLGLFAVSGINVIKFRLLPGSDNLVEVLDTQRCGYKLAPPESNYLYHTYPGKRFGVCIADPLTILYQFYNNDSDLKLGWWLCEAPKHHGPFTRTGKPTDEMVGYGIHVIEGIKMQKVVRILVLGGVLGVASAVGIWIRVGDSTLAVGTGLGAVLAAWVWVVLVQILVGIGRG